MTSAHLFHARVLAPANETIWWTLRGNLLLLRRDEEALADFLAFEPHGARTARMLVAGLASARRLAIRDREARALRAVLEHAWTSGESELLAEVLAHVQYFDVTREALLALYRHYDRIVRAELAAAGDDAPLAPAPVVAALPAVEPPLPMAPAAGPSDAAGSGPVAADTDLELAVVKSPIVGTFYRSAEPGAKSFVSVGDTVRKGEVLCIIEAMKLMNEIDSEYDGEIVNIYVENGQAVQYGERLFAIRTR